eukprot:3477151-Pleurochrysis_carterae.AAC.1
MVCARSPSSTPAKPYSRAYPTIFENRTVAICITAIAAFYLFCHDVCLMASTGFKLEKDMPLKQLIAGLEPLMPVGSRNFSMLEADGTDSKGETKFKETSLASLQ